MRRDYINRMKLSAGPVTVVVAVNVERAALPYVIAAAISGVSCILAGVLAGFLL